ncbi:hypothetical protein D3C76_176250 [compost metagenome]
MYNIKNISHYIYSERYFYIKDSLGGIKMALIGHYPLIKNANDMTINKNHGTATGVTFVTGGKLGGYANFNLATDKIVIPHSNLVSTKAFGTSNTASFSIWAYITAWPGAGSESVLFSKATGAYYSNMTVSIAVTNLGFQAVLGSNRINNPAGGHILITNKPALNAWYNLVITLDGTNMNFYVNGISTSNALSDVTLSRSENTASITIGPRVSSIADSGLKGYVADFKIYDHTLSKKEITELLRAKVAHYKCGSFQEPGTNRSASFYSMFTNLPINGSVDATNGYLTTKNYITVTRLGKNKYKVLYKQDVIGSYVWTFGYCGLETGLQTISADISEYYLASGSVGNFGITMEPSTSSYIVSSSILLYGVDAKNRKSLTFSYDTSLFSNTLGVGQPTGSTIKAGSYIVFDNVQAERLPYSTPYITDEVSRYRSGTMFDTSGYDRDAILSTWVGNVCPRWINESPIGVGSYDFVNGSNAQIIPYGANIDLSVFPHTFSMWVKTPVTTGNEVFISSGVTSARLFYIRKNTGMWTFSIQSNETTSTLPAAAVVANKWTHLALVFDGSVGTLYVDGVVAQTKTYTSFTLPQDLTLGKLYNSSTIYWTGTITDIRIYSSTFTSTDVRELYKNRANLDENGNLKIEKFSSSVGAMYRFYSMPTVISATTLTQQPGAMLMNGVARLTATSVDPQLTFNSTSTPDFARSLSSIDPAVFKYTQVKYRVISGTGLAAEIYFTNTRRPDFNADQRSNLVALNTDGDWHIMTFDMSNAYWNHSAVTGLRLDYCDKSGAIVDIEYIRICKDNNDNVNLNDNGVIEANSLTVNGPLHGLSFWWPLKGSTQEIASPVVTTQELYSATPVSFGNSMGYQFNNGSFFSTVAANLVSLKNGSFSFWINLNRAYTETNGVKSWVTPGFDIFRFDTLRSAMIVPTLRLYSDSSQSLKLEYSFYNTNTSPINTYSLNLPNAISTFQGQNTHVVINYSDVDYNGSVGAYAIYVNGVKIAASNVLSTTITAWRARDIRLSPDGIISDVRMYQRVLSEYDINLLYESFGNDKNKMKYLNDGSLYIKGNIKEV